jgi:ferredoxin
MKVGVRYLTTVRSITTKSKEEFELISGTLGELLNFIEEKYSLKKKLGNITVLVNSQPIRGNLASYKLAENDDVIITAPSIGIGNRSAFITDDCTGCGSCAKECPKNAINIIKSDDKKRAFVNSKLCVDCGACKKVCNFNAIVFLPSKGIKCTSCPVFCTIKDGEYGACKRYKNERGRLVLSRRISVPAQKRFGEPLVYGVGAGNTYPDFVPAPIIVEGNVEGVDVVTVVSATPLSFSHLKLKIDTDEFIGTEGQTVYRDGKKVGIVVTEEYGSKMIDIGGVNILQSKTGLTAARTIVDIVNGKEVELKIGKKSWIRFKLGKQPVINGKKVRKMRAGCGSAIIGMFAPYLKKVADEAIILDSHIIGLLSEHYAGKYLGMKYSGIIPWGVKSTDGRYFGEHGDGIGGTPIKDPLDAIKKIDFNYAWEGMRVLITDTTGEHLSMFELRGERLKEIEPTEEAKKVVKMIFDTCEDSGVSALFCGGVGGSARAGVAKFPKKVTEAVHKGLIKLTIGGAPAFVLPGGGINFYVNVEEIKGKDPLTYVPTPAIVAPIEYTMERKVYEEIGGHIENKMSYNEFIKKYEVELL